MIFSQKDYQFLESMGIECSEQKRQAHSGLKVIVGMSGGVDSSVAAIVNLAQGYQVSGIFMKNWEADSDFCTAKEDFQDVVSVCEKLGIDYYSVNFSREYYDDVFQNFLSEYQKGRTPNPDILCNSKIKFDVFFKYAKSLGANYVATGHYAQISDKGALMKGLDQGKDQSYFLYRVPETVWQEVLFPLGHLEKKQVRLIAERFNLTTQNKKDSTGICFIGEKNFREFLSRYIKEQKGFFKTLDETIVGEHKGQCFYTIGQRKGLGLGGAGQPWYVIKKDNQTNDVYVERGEHPALFIDDLLAVDFVGKGLLEMTSPIELTCKVRYRQKDQKCHIEKTNKGLRVFFKTPQKGVAIGQSIVFYKGNVCLGGAIIEQLGQNHYDKQKTEKE